MIDLSTEHVVTLTEATRHLPRRRKGRKPAVSTLYRWATGGVRGVRLETIMVGGCRCTSTEALQRFVEQLTRAVDGPSTGATSCNRQRQAQVRAAERELEAAGI